MRGKLALIGILGLLIGGASVGSTLFLIAIRDISTIPNSNDELEDEYNNLESEYNNMTSDYNSLTYEYNDLVQEYNKLFGDYQYVICLLEDPLINPVIPTFNQSNSWLSSDDTDTHDYVNSTWMSGDFASILMVKAKEMNWRIRVVTMFYSFSGDVGYGTTDPFGSYGHAFNLIFCQDGSDPDIYPEVYYIEPQTDTVWHIDDGSGNYINHSLYSYYTGGLNGTVWQSGSYWVNH